MTLLEEAIQYVRDNATWTEAEFEAARDKVERYRCGIAHADSYISDAIYDLMEEFGEDNDLPEGWFLDVADEDDIFRQL